MSGILRRWNILLSRMDKRGVAALEFALVLPMLSILIFGAVEFGIILNQYQTLTNATIVGVKQFAFGIGVSPTPYTDARTAISTAAPRLTPLAIRLFVNATECTSDADCKSKAAAAGSSGYVTVTLSYSCIADNFLPSLITIPTTISSQQTERIQ